MTLSIENRSSLPRCAGALSLSTTVLMSIVLMTVVAALCGCAGSVIFGHTVGDRSTPAPSQLTDWKFGPPSVVSTADASAAEKADPRFSSEALAAAVATELGARQLMVASSSAAADHSIEVTIEQFSVQPASNAVILGHELNNATLAGTIRVRGSDGRELRRFEVEAKSGLVASTDNPSAQPLAALYRRFGHLVADNLTGRPVRTASPEMPR